jgi:glycosyltransferase involved in cell wall biosynthesis
MRADLEVTVLAGPDDTDEGTYWDSPALSEVATFVVPNLVRRLSPRNDFAALVWLIRWLRANRPDVVHTHSSKAGVLGRIAARVAGVRCVHTVHGWGPLCSSSAIVRFLATAVERGLASLCDALVVVGTPDLQVGLDRRIGSADKYRVIRSGVDTGLARAAANERDGVRAEMGLTSSFVIGMVARMSFQKDHATLVRAFAAADIPDAVLVLVGDGPLRSDITTLIDELDQADRVRVLGVRPDAARLVAGFDIAVLSSRWEGMPRSVVEAAAAGVPVVATDVGSVSELIEDGRSGMLVPVEGVDQLASALRELYDNRAQALVMAEVAARRAEEFSVDRMRHELADLWTSLATRAPR